MDPAASLALVQVGLLLAAVLAVQVVSVHHLADDDIPWVLRSRVAWSNRVRPWVAAAAVVLLAAGAASLLLPA